MYPLWALPSVTQQATGQGPEVLTAGEQLALGDTCIAEEWVYFPLGREETEQGCCWVSAQPGQQASPLPPQASHIVLGLPSHQTHFGAILPHFILP